MRYTIPIHSRPSFSIKHFFYAFAIGIALVFAIASWAIWDELKNLRVDMSKKFTVSKKRVTDCGIQYFREGIENQAVLDKVLRLGFSTAKVRFLKCLRNWQQRRLVLYKRSKWRLNSLMRLLSIWLSFAILSLAPHSYAEGSPEDEPQEAISAFLHLPVSLGTEIVLYSLSLTGTQYKYGGDSPEKGFDCSGLIRHVYQRVSGLLLPHSARAINAAATKVPLDELQPGDVVFYNTLKRAYSHVGIYLGNQRFIHAASSGRTTQVSSMTDKYWLKRFDGAGRLLTPLLPALRVNEDSP